MTKKATIAKCFVKVRNRTLIKAKPFISYSGGNFLSVKVVTKISNHSSASAPYVINKKMHMELGHPVLHSRVPPLAYMEHFTTVPK